MNRLCLSAVRRCTMPYRPVPAPHPSLSLGPLRVPSLDGLRWVTTGPLLYLAVRSAPNHGRDDGEWSVMRPDGLAEGRKLHTIRDAVAELIRPLVGDPETWK